MTLTDEERRRVKDLRRYVIGKDSKGDKARGDLGFLLRLVKRLNRFKRTAAERSTT